MDDDCTIINYKNRFDKSDIDKIGFGEYINDAIDLMKTLIELLNKYNIDYYIISGTLLGHVRHNGFIPWDDDIDIIVSEDILDKLPLILLNTELTFLKFDNWILKACSKTGISEITNMHTDKLINKNDKYYWPFIDLFIYTKNDTHLNFFKKLWLTSEFEPYNLKKFYDISVRVPNNPDYFLKITYGIDYLNSYEIYTWHHRKERIIKFV